MDYLKLRPNEPNEYFVQQKYHLMKTNSYSVTKGNSLKIEIEELNKYAFQQKDGLINIFGIRFSQCCGKNEGL